MFVAEASSCLGVLDADASVSLGALLAEASACLGVLDADASVSLGALLAEASACLGVLDAEDCLGVLDAEDVVIAVLLTIALGDAIGVIVVEYCDCVRLGDTEAVGHASAWHNCGLEVFVKHIRIAVWQAIWAGSQHVGLAPAIGLAPTVGHASA